MRLGLVIAVLAFLVVGGDVLLDQLITGYASAEFILGTAALIAGVCIRLFFIDPIDPELIVGLTAPRR
jgi:hypothetical protein